MNNRIIIDPHIQHGKPIIKGTRVPVTRILGGLAAGMTSDDLIKEYDITLKDIRAAISYANDIIEHETAHPLPQ